MTKPLFSPAMLRLFLRARAEMHVREHSDMPREKAIKAFRSRVRREADVSAETVDLAFEGRLREPLGRARLWGFLGLTPGNHGIALTNGGQKALATPGEKA